MKRRRLLQMGAATWAAGLGGRPCTSAPGPDTASLLKLLEDRPRAQIPSELVQRIRSGLAHRALLEALATAAVRNVQPYPDVGFKYHAVMVLQSVQLTTAGLPPGDEWLPSIWAADYFKQTQAAERRQTGWRMPTRPRVTITDPESARRSLTAALDAWDRDAADAAVVACTSLLDSEALFELLFPYGARDLRAIGHKAITVQNAHRLIGILGPEPGVPILRSVVAALQNAGGDVNPAGADLPPDRPWAANRARVADLPASWRSGRTDAGARQALLQALRQTSEEDAGGVVVDHLKRGTAPGTLWDALFAAAAELVLRQPGILPVHALTTASALHYAYSASSRARTQQLALLQCASFVSMFRAFVGDARADLRVDALEPLALESGPGEAVDEIFSTVPADRSTATRKALAYLRRGGDAAAMVARARRHLAHNGSEAHEYKFAEAAFENATHASDPAWGSRLLAASLAYVPGPVPERPSAAVAEAAKLLAG
jgi:hypothetical protein